MNGDTRWRNCPYQRYFHEQNSKRLQSVNFNPSEKQGQHATKMAFDNSPESGPPTFLMSDSNALPGSPETPISMVNDKEGHIQGRHDEPKLNVSVPLTPPDCNDLHKHWLNSDSSELSPTSAAILKDSVEFEDPNDMNIEYDEKKRPKLKVLTTFRGGF
jgi:hypothetical protein